MGIKKKITAVKKSIKRKKVAPRKKSKRSHICEHVGFLKCLKESGLAKRRQLLSGCTREQVLCICEVSDNILRGKVPLNKQQVKKLAPHEEELKCLADNKLPLKKKQEFLQTQRGAGFFLPALAATLPWIIDNIPRLWAKK